MGQLEQRNAEKRSPIKARMSDLQRRAVMIFMAIAFGWTCCFVWLATKQSDSGFLRSVSMYGPAVGALTAHSLVLRRPLSELGFNRTLRPGGWAGPTFMFLFVVAACGIGLLIYPAALVSAADLAEHGAIVAISENPWIGLSAIATINIFLAPLLNLPMFLGEEIGWRGFLNRHLAESSHRGYLFGGIIWGLWHVPMIAVFGLNYPEHATAGSVLFVVICVELNIVLGYFYRRTPNIFVLAYTHGVLNWTTSTVYMFLLVDGQAHPLIFGPAGCLGAGVLLIPAIVCYRRLARLPPTADEPAAEPGSEVPSVA